MNPDRWKQVQKAYFGALALTAEQQTPYLETVCAGDLHLQKEVESLLGYKDKVGEFLEQTAIEVLVRAYGLKAQDENGARVEDLVGTIIDDRYVVSKHIGSGGMGDVYRADHRLLGVPVAIKRLATGLRDRKEYRQRFVTEARRAVLLDHENIAEVKDVVEQSNEVFVVMEFIDGQTLRKRLEHPFNVDEFLPFASQCASALAAAHEQRIIHLDIKPENIMLTGSNKVKVCDFGVAHQLSAIQDGSIEPPPPWTFAGTPPYMAPEVLESNQFDERADIFSLGLVFYEMLAGTHPFRSENLQLTTKRIVTESAPSLSQVSKKIPARLVRLVERMLAKKPAERIGSAGEVLRELQIIRRHHRFFRDKWHTAAELGASVARRPAPTLASIIILAIVIVGASSYFGRLSRGAPLPEKKILVILPFRVIGQAGDERFYSEGVSEILTAKLAELSTIPDLQIASTSLVREKQINTLEKARAEFGANLVLDGTFQFSRDQVRFSYALTDIAAGHDVARNEKTVPIADPFKLQDGVVRDLLRMLRIKLTTDQQEALAVYGTDDFKAFSLYTSGMGALANYQEPENVEKAINLFSQAAQQDDRYALAYAALGRAYWQKFSRVKDAALLELSRTSCEKAASLNVRLSEAQVCLGRVRQERGDAELAVEYFQRAIEYSPTNDDAYRARGSALEDLNRYDEAEKTYQQAIDGRPILGGPFVDRGVL